MVDQTSIYVIGVDQPFLPAQEVRLSYMYIVMERLWIIMRKQLKNKMIIMWMRLKIIHRERCSMFLTTGTKPGRFIR